MAKKIKEVRKHYQRYKNFSFSELMTKADEEFLESIMEMDTQGNVLSESKFNQLGELEEMNTLTYTGDGKLLEHVLFYALDDVTEKRQLKRNDKGRLLEEVKYYGDDSGERSAYEYNEADLIIAIIEYDEEGQFISREDVIYDAQGSIVERTKKDATGGLIDKVIFEKTSDGKIILEKEFGEDGELKSVTTISFDESGKELTSFQSTPEGRLITGVETIYDEKGNVIERQYKDHYSKTVRYEYDDANKMITQELFDGSGLLLRKNIYEYDESGNLRAEQTFEMDNSRGNKEKHFGTRYEYAYYEE